MTDTIIAVVCGVTQLAIAWYAGHIFLEKGKIRFAAIVWGLGVLAIVLSGLSTYRGVTASSKLEGKISELKTLQRVTNPTSVPVNVQFDTKALAKVLTENRQGPTEAKESEKTASVAIDPLKVEALELSSDILTFLFDRASGTPNIVRRMLSLQLNQGESIEDYRRRSDVEIKAFTDYQSDTVSRYQTRFEPRSLEILGKLRTKGVDISTIWYRPNTPESIQAFALGLVAVSNRLK